MSASGCLTHSSLQTARTTLPGRGVTYVGINAFNSDSINSEIDANTEFDKGSIKDYSLILGHRRGYQPNIDWGFQVAFVGTAKFDAKYMFYDNEGFAAAGGFALAYSQLETGKGSSRSQAKIVDYIFPLYSSYSFGRDVSVYLTPQYMIRDVSGDISGGMALFGYTVGLMGGSRFRLALEFTQMQSGIQNFALGYYFQR